MIFKTQVLKDEAIVKQKECIKNAQHENPSPESFAYLAEIEAATIEVFPVGTPPNALVVKSADGSTRLVLTDYNLEVGESFVGGTSTTTKTVQFEDGSTKTVKVNYVLKAGESF